MGLKIFLLFTRGLALLPLSWLHALAVPLGALIAAGGRRRRVTLVNLRASYPCMGEPELQKLMRISCREFAKTALETPIFWHWPLERIIGSIIDVRGEKIMKKAQRCGRGILIALPHFGAWELLPFFLTTRVNLAALYKPSGNDSLDRLMLQQRQRSGVKLFAADNRGLRKIYGHLREGKVLLILPDQQPKSGAGKFAPFFGIQTLTMTLFPRLVQRTGCQVVFAVCDRLPEGSGYRIHFLPADKEIYAEDIDRALAALNKGVEDCVAIAPAQYLWGYKRFSLRPPGEPPFY